MLDEGRTLDVVDVAAEDSILALVLHFVNGDAERTEKIGAFRSGRHEVVLRVEDVCLLTRNSAPVRHEVPRRDEIRWRGKVLTAGLT